MTKIKAGKTDAWCGERVRITKISTSDSEEQQLVGATGRITHPFAGLMVGSTANYIAGIWLDPGSGMFGKQINLIQGDEVEVIDHATAYDNS